MNDSERTFKEVMDIIGQHEDLIKKVLRERQEAREKNRNPSNLYKIKPLVWTRCPAWDEHPDKYCKEEWDASHGPLAYSVSYIQSMHGSEDSYEWHLQISVHDCIPHYVVDSLEDGKAKAEKHYVESMESCLEKV